MTSSDPDEIRQQIEQTRRELSYDVDALNEKANPARAVDRQVSRAKGSVTGLKDRVFGAGGDSSSGMSSTASSATGSVHDATSSAAQTVQNAPDAIHRQTQGNPMAAGLIAFGVGWLVSSLLPTSEKEKELAAQAESTLKQPLMDQAKQVAQEAGEALKPAAQQAVESVKGTAQDAAQTVTEHGRSAAADVKDQAQSSRENVQDHAGS